MGRTDPNSRLCDAFDRTFPTGRATTLWPRRVTLLAGDEVRPSQLETLGLAEGTLRIANKANAQALLTVTCA